MLPLEGMIVADFTNWFPGPYCTRLLLDLLKEHDIAANSVTSLEEIPKHGHFVRTQLLNTDPNFSPATGIAFPAIVNDERWGKSAHWYRTWGRIPFAY